MIQTTPRTADFIMSQSRTFKAAMHFEDGSGVKITATIVSFDVSMTIPEDDISPGMVLSSQANITVAEDINTGVGNDLEGKHFQLYLIPDIYANGTTYGDLRTYTHADLSSFTHGEIRTLTGEPIPMGRYKVTSCKVVGDKTTIEAHDDLYGADKAFTSEKHTVAEIENDICNALGIPDRRRSSDIDSMTISALPEECTIREMLGIIAALDGGKAAYIDREGYLAHKDMASVNYTVSRSRSAEPETEKKAIRVTGLCCKIDDDPTHDLTAGTVTRMITFSNPYMTNQIFGQIAAKFVGLSYRPLSAKYILGDPRLELLDIVMVQGSDGKSFTVPVTALTYNFDGGLCCNIVAGGKTDTQASAGEGPMTRYFKTVAEKAADTSAQNLMKSMQEAVNYITDPSGAGGYHFQAYNNDGKLVADYWTDNPDINHATNILMINKNGIAATNAGLTGQWKMAITNTGIINASQILTGTLTAIMIQSANYTSSAGSRLDLSDGTFSFAGGKLTYNGSTLEIEGKCTVSDNDSKAVLNDAKMQLYRDDEYLGFVGTQKDSGNNRGIVFDMTPNCDYMSWGAQDTQGGEYKQKYTWYRGVGFNFYDDIDMHNYDISNADIIDADFDGTATFRGSKVQVNNSTDLEITGTQSSTGKFDCHRALDMHNYTISNTTIVNSSDRRLKENIKDSEVNALDIICALKPRAFDWKADGQHQGLGFVADEMQAVCEDFAATLPDGMQGIKLLETVPYLIKAVQELKDENERLKERVSRLEHNT